MSLDDTTQATLAALVCEQTCTRMNVAFDMGQIDDGLACLTEDAAWHRPDGTLAGRDAIETYYRERRQDMVVCHVLTNFVVDFTSQAEATCSYYSTGYLNFRAEGAELPVPMPAPGVIWRYTDTLRHDGSRWRVCDRRPVRLMEGTA